jgi:hypothetical protein
MLFLVRETHIFTLMKHRSQSLVRYDLTMMVLDTNRGDKKF